MPDPIRIRRGTPRALVGRRDVAVIVDCPHCGHRIGLGLRALARLLAEYGMRLLDRAGEEVRGG